MSWEAPTLEAITGQIPRAQDSPRHAGITIWMDYAIIHILRQQIIRMRFHSQTPHPPTAYMNARHTEPKRVPEAMPTRPAATMMLTAALNGAAPPAARQASSAQTVSAYASQRPAQNLASNAEPGTIPAAAPLTAAPASQGTPATKDNAYVQTDARLLD